MTPSARTVRWLSVVMVVLTVTPIGPCVGQSEVRVNGTASGQLGPFAGLRYDIKQLDEVCLECICDDYRGTGCDIDDLCGRGRNGDCDLLGIDRTYWVTAGQPMVVGQEADVDFAALNCRRDPECSGRAVLGMMARYETACRRTAPARTCVDYAAVHINGIATDKCDVSPSQRLKDGRRARIVQCLEDKAAAAALALVQASSLAKTGARKVSTATTLRNQIRKSKVGD